MSTFLSKEEVMSLLRGVNGEDERTNHPLVFLGGTCNRSTWREALIPQLTAPYFNPVVKDWTPDCQEEELRQRDISSIVLYTITPAMMGVYSIAEVVDDSNKRPERTVLCLLPEYDGKAFTDLEWKSLQAVAAMVWDNGAYVCYSLESLAEYVNKGNK